MFNKEFQAVVLAAGRGSRMAELTVGRPKCLLPVGNDAILFNALKLLSNAGFQDAIVVVLKSFYASVQQMLNQKNMQLSVDLVEIPTEEDWGTADSLRFLVNQKKIKSDIVLLSCDLFTNVDINSLLHTFRKHKAAFCAQFFLPYEAFSTTDPVPGVKSKHKPERDIVGFDSKTQRLTFLASASDFEESLFLSRNILKKHPRLSLRTDLVDGHLYVITKGLAEYLAAESSLSTLKGEFFPHIVKKRHLAVFKTDQDTAELGEKEDRGEEGYDTVQGLSTYTDHRGDLRGAYHGDTLRSFAIIADPQIYGIRVNTTMALCQANKMYWNAAQDSSDVPAEVRVSTNAVVQSTQVDAQSFIGAGCSIHEKTSIRSSSIGESCVVQPKTRIANSILFNRVNIGERCVIDNCIVCDDAVIGSDCELKNCVVGAFHALPEKTKAAFQVLTKSDGLMEIE